MKKCIVPALIFICVYIVCLCFQRYTLINAESLGLFLMTPDYIREVFTNPWPISSLLNDFLIQFFRYSYISQAIVALVITVVFLLTRSLLSRITAKGSIPGTIAAMAVWYFITKGQSLTIGITVILIECILLILSSFLRKRFWDESNISIYISAGLVLACCIVIITDKEIRSNERWSAVEFATIRQDWNLVLQKATPKAAAKDRDLIPYAMLALNAKNELTERMKDYPVRSIEDLDMEGINSRRGYLFTSYMYESLNCLNEAVHQNFQAACFLPHGTSFHTLRRLVALNYAIGDYALVAKYCSILKQSCCHDEFVQTYMELIKDGRERIDKGFTDSSEVALLTHNPQYNLYSLQKMGISSGTALDRFKAYLLFTHTEK